MTTTDPRDTLHRLRQGPGPIVILDKGHSGSRVLARALLEGGVFLGNDMNVSLDSAFWNLSYGPTMMASPWFPDFPDSAELRELSRAVLEAGIHGYVDRESSLRPWGWKGGTLFVTPVVAREFPEARFVHLIRDGRDVATSMDGRLNLPFDHPILARDLRRMVRRMRTWRRHRDDDRHRLRIVFGRDDVAEWNGLRIDRRTVSKNRFQIQMQSWIHHISTARRHALDLGDRYTEVRYEDLCRTPVAVLRSVFDDLGLAWTEAVERWAEATITDRAVGRWARSEFRGERRSDFERAVQLAKPLLADLGYL